MFLVLRLLYHELSKANASFERDPRTANLPLLGSPWPMVCILILYLLFVKKWGPAMMANRKPFNTTVPMQIYNVMQVLLNSYIFISSVRWTYMQPHFNFSCQPYNPHDMRPANMHLRYSAYAYYISKYLDLFDTVFFVLRKKHNQISFLHVYHHTIMVYAVWTYATLLFGSHFTATGVVNSFIHVCMYAYYFTAALKLQIDLNAWKRRLTQMQILQFCFLTIHFARPIVNNWCGMDMFWVWIAFVQNLFMLAMFVEFYITAYLKSWSKSATQNGKSTNWTAYVREAIKIC